MKPLVTVGTVVGAVVLTAAAISVIAVAASPSFLDALSKLGAVATALVAVFALIVGIFTIRQKQGADAETAEAERRDQWWKRAQWAIDRLYEPPEERQVAAWRVLQTLFESNLAGDEERAIFRAVAGDGLARLNPVETEHPYGQQLTDTGDEPEGMAE